jgi:hypothetical protein
MTTGARLLTGLAVSALLLAGTNLALAQDKGMAKDTKMAAPMKAAKGEAKTTVLLENAKVKVNLVEYKPGEENKAVPSSSSRVVHALKGGTLMRTYADGKTENIVWKNDEWRFNEATKQAYTAKNTGKTDIVLQVVQLK